MNSPSTRALWPLGLLGAFLASPPPGRGDDSAGWAIRPGSARHRGASVRSKTAPPGEASSSNSKEGNRVLKGVLRGGPSYDPMHFGRHRPGLASWSTPALVESGCGHCTGERRGEHASAPWAASTP